MPSSAPTSLYTLSLHDALPISPHNPRNARCKARPRALRGGISCPARTGARHRRPLPRTVRGHALGVVGRDRSGLAVYGGRPGCGRSEEHTSELQSLTNLVCRLLRPPRSTLFPYTTLFRSRPITPEMPGVKPVRERFAAELVALHEPAHATAAHYRALFEAMRSVSSAGTGQVWLCTAAGQGVGDRKSTRLNSSH